MIEEALPCLENRLMKVIDAIWEKRNLDLYVSELIFERGDTINDFLKIEDDLRNHYIVAKIPNQNIELVHNLEQFSFRYLENQISILFNHQATEELKTSWIDRFQKFTCEILIEESDLNTISRLILEGLFENDRFSIDPFISDEKPNLRISNWLRDIFKREAPGIYLIKDMNRKIVGFFVLKNPDAKTLFVELAGIFKEYRNKGYSFLLLKYILSTAKILSMNSIRADISSNNMNTLNTFARFVPFKIVSNNVVLRRIPERD